MSARDLLHVLLPDNSTILSASLPVHPPDAPHRESSVDDLLRALLSDAANAGSLQRVFGAHFDAAAAQEQDAGQAGATWRIDGSGMSWALQTVESSSSNREWAEGELEALGDGECALLFQRCVVRTDAAYTQV